MHAAQNHSQSLVNIGNFMSSTMELINNIPLFY
jgi:hypothetical protein